MRCILNCHLTRLGSDSRSDQRRILAVCFFSGEGGWGFSEKWLESWT